MNKLRVLVVDDTIVYRRVLSDAVESTGLGVVEHSAPNGLLALEWLKQKDIDVVLMDVFMPEMNGIDALKIIKKEHPEIEVIMVSTSGSESASITLDALASGALDFILKPTESTPERNLEKIRNQLQALFTQIKVKKISSPVHSQHNMPPTDLPTQVNKINESKPHDTEIVHRVKPSPLPWIGADIVLIASSTGGPSALETVCTKLSEHMRKPVLIVQHMPPEFTRILAQSLDKKCPLHVIEGSEGDLIKNSQIIISPGGVHMSVKSDSNGIKKIILENTAFVNGVRPAADVLFNSVASEYKDKNILAVILTGMGNDGMQGVAELKKNCNCYCITQSEASCVIYGMPRSVYEAGLSDEVCDINRIAERINQVAYGRS